MKSVNVVVSGRGYPNGAHLGPGHKETYEVAAGQGEK